MRFNTALLHQVEKGDKETGATLTPIYHSSAFYQSSAEQHEKLLHNKANGFSYTRINNPTILAFENEMTASMCFMILRHLALKQYLWIFTMSRRWKPPSMKRPA